MDWVAEPETIDGILGIILVVAGFLTLGGFGFFLSGLGLIGQTMGGMGTGQGHLKHQFDYDSDIDIEVFTKKKKQELVDQWYFK